MATPTDATVSTVTWYRWVKLSRCNKFAGSMLIFWPVAWSVTMSAYSLALPPSAYAYLMVYGLLGAAVLHSAGCVWNDILDRDLDRLVERTKHRPIASGQVSVPGALIFTSMHLIALIACIWPFNKYAWYMGLVAIFPLPGIYPLMKRITYWPQAWLGVAVNFPAAVAIMALHPNAIMSAATLVMAGWCWTLHYDTIYGSQDKKDDVKAGVKSTALLFGQHTRSMLLLFSSLMVSCLAIAGMLNRQAAWFFIVSVGGATLHFFYQIFSVNTESPQSCLKFFEANAWQLGGIIWAGLFLDYLFV